MDKMKTGLITVLLIIFLLPEVLTGETQSVSTPPPGHRGDYLTLKVAVFGPGDPLYVWWGHIGLIVEDRISGRSIFYDYGLFSFDNENFFLNFAMGRMLYSCGGSSAQRNLDRYQSQNRDITLYTLDIAPEKKMEVWDFAEKNILPENRNYYYHQFDDNCSTRIRDIVDLAVDGQFYEYGTTPGRYTLREHVRRHTWFSPFMDWLVMFLLGESVDRKITVWEEMFLPSEVGNQIENFTYTDPSGNTRKLVSETEIYFRAENRPAVLDTPRKQWPVEAAAGLLLAALIIFLKLKRSKTGRICLGTVNSILGLILGTAGTILCFMSFFTNHDYTWNNLNTLFINPLFLAAVPAGIQSAAGRGRKGKFGADRLLSVLWTLTFCTALLSIILNLMPGINNDNRITLAFFLPVSFVMSIFFSKFLKKAGGNGGGNPAGRAISVKNND